MSVGGWVFMIFSWTWIIGLLIWSFHRLVNQDNGSNGSA
jgi:hypothetical protein